MQSQDQNAPSVNAPPTGAIPPPGIPSQDEHPATHYVREDERWDVRNQLRDWLVLLVMILIYLAWTGVIFLFEPGIR